MRRLLQYNFSKLKKRKAEFISQHGFLKTLGLTVNNLMSRFKWRFEKNFRTKTNVVHISLNFFKNDNLSYPILSYIGSTDLSKIGFGEQHYLVFKHGDANHSQIYILTTNINRHGARIEHNIGKTLS